MSIPSTVTVKRLKNYYPAGTRIELDYMDDWKAIPDGATGTVFFVDDIGTVHVEWDNGSVLGLVYGEDRFHAI